MVREYPLFDQVSLTSHELLSSARNRTELERHLTLSEHYVAL